MSVVCGNAKCRRSNKDTARYCKYCGQKLFSQAALGIDELVGRDSVKGEIMKIISMAEEIERIRKSGDSVPGANFNTILIGNTGTGKNKIVEILNSVLHRHGITSKDSISTVEAVDYQKFVSEKEFEQNFRNAKGGILFVNDVQKLVPAGYSGAVEPLDKLVSEMRKSPLDPIVVLAGLPKGFREYVKCNPDVLAMFQYTLELPDMDADHMMELAGLRLRKHGFTLSDDAQTILRKLFVHLFKTRDESFSNGHLVNRQITGLIKNYYLRVGRTLNDSMILPEDVRAEIPEEKTLSEILGELDSLVGMEQIKREIRELAETLEVKRRKAKATGETFALNVHWVLKGNPGTGKTTIARKLGETLRAIGLLDRGHVVETDRKDLVAEFVGQTAPRINAKIDEAMGGILFIDEAYQLVPEGISDAYGKEAIATLLKRMEDDRGKFVVVAAGYPDEMERFLNGNPGFRSRFTGLFHINDYPPQELLAIFRSIAAANKYQIEEGAEEKLSKVFEDMHQRRDRNFGNGRAVRDFFEKGCLRLQAKRCISQAIFEGAELSLIRTEDVPSLDEDVAAIGLDDALQELDDLIGLDSVKSQVRKLTDYLKIEKLRASAGERKTPLTIHFVFRGNPGTGKTTVARILANVFQAIGLLAKGHLVESNRKDLVGEYQGHTAVRTNARIDKAMGGVLFVDEAYALVLGGQFDSFGREAIATLLARMENDRGKFVAIAAGYKEEMESFLDSNPGLRSRFTNYIDFPDYTPVELQEIFLSMARSRKMKLSEGVDELLTRLFEDVYDRRDRSFANGRTVRTMFERVLQNQASRLASMPDPDEEGIPRDILNTITLDDFESVEEG